jgi:hypothetical protein
MPLIYTLCKTLQLYQAQCLLFVILSSLIIASGWQWWGILMPTINCHCWHETHGFWPPTPTSDWSTSHVCPHYTAPTQAAQKTILPRCCVFTHRCRNSFTVPLPSNGHLYSFHYSGFQLCGHNIIDNLNAVHELDILFSLFLTVVTMQDVTLFLRHVTNWISSYIPRFN